MITILNVKDFLRIWHMVALKLLVVIVKVILKLGTLVFLFIVLFTILSCFLFILQILVIFWLRLTFELR